MLLLNAYTASTRLYVFSICICYLFNIRVYIRISKIVDFLLKTSITIPVKYGSSGYYINLIAFT